MRKISRENHGERQAQNATQSAFEATRWWRNWGSNAQIWRGGSRPYQLQTLALCDTGNRLLGHNHMNFGTFSDKVTADPLGFADVYHFDTFFPKLWRNDVKKKEANSAEATVRLGDRDRQVR